MSARLARMEADTWNRNHPVGTLVKLRKRDGTLAATRTRSKAFVTEAGFAVCHFEGFTAFFLLSRATPLGKASANATKR